MRHDVWRTVKTYEQWLRRFLRFHQLRHPREMGSEEDRGLLERDLDLEGDVREQTRRRLPVVFSEAEMRSVRQWLGGRSSPRGGVAI